MSGCCNETRRSLPGWAPALVAALAVALAGASASGQPSRREFDRLVRAAAEHYNTGDARAAIQELERAYAIRPLPRLLYNLGRAHELAGEPATSVTYYERFLGTNPTEQEAAVAREALEVARRHVAEREAEAERQRQAEAERQRVETERLAALERARLAELQRQRTPHPRARPRRLTAPVLTSFGLAGAGVITGVVFGALALGAQSTFNETRDAAQRADQADRGAAFATVTDVALGTALVAAGLGLVLYYTQPTTELVP